MKVVLIPQNLILAADRAGDEVNGSYRYYDGRTYGRVPYYFDDEWHEFMTKLVAADNAFYLDSRTALRIVAQCENSPLQKALFLEEPNEFIELFLNARSGYDRKR